MICYEEHWSDYNNMNMNMNIPQKIRASLCPITQNNKRCNMLRIRSIQHHATSTYHRGVVRRYIQSQTRAKNTICYEGRQLDRYDKRWRSHTTRETCEAMSSHLRSEADTRSALGSLYQIYVHPPQAQRHIPPSSTTLTSSEQSFLQHSPDPLARIHCYRCQLFHRKRSKSKPG